jgi:hypothetical protein
VLFKIFFYLKIHKIKKIYIININTSKPLKQINLLFFKLKIFLKNTQLNAKHQIPFLPLHLTPLHHTFAPASPW